MLFKISHLTMRHIECTMYIVRVGKGKIAELKMYNYDILYDLDRCPCIFINCIFIAL